MHLAQAQGILDVQVRLRLQHEGADRGAKEQLVLQLHIDAGAQFVAKAHLAQGFHQAPMSQHIDRLQRSLFPQALQPAQGCANGLIIDRSPFHFRPQQPKRVASRLKLVGDQLARLAHAHREGNQGGRNVDVLKAAGHGVLAADGRKSQAHLRLQRAEQGGKGLAPAAGVLLGALEIFLEGKPAAV